MAAYKRHSDPPVDVVIDLETLGKPFYSPIVQMGYTTLDMSQGEQINISWDQNSLKQFRLDQGTVDWWNKRPTTQKAGVFGSGHSALGAIHELMSRHASAQASVSHPDMGEHLASLFQDPTMGFVSIREAFQRFCGFIRSLGNNVHIWTHVSFDYGLIKYTMEQLKMEAPWGYYHVHDLRTCNALAGKMAPPREGTYHTALADARHEAGILQTQLAIMGISSASQLHMDWKGVKSPYNQETQDNAVALLQQATKLARLALGDLRHTQDIPALISNIQDILDEMAPTENQEDHGTATESAQRATEQPVQTQQG